MIISIDGLDGSGKSSLAKKIAETLEFKYIERPLHEIFKFNDENYIDVALKIEDKIYNHNEASSKVKAMLTLLGITYLKDAERTNNIVMDRGLLSCYGYNGYPDTHAIFEMMININMLPDITILLTADKEVRMNRIRKRDKNDSDLTDPETLKQSYEALQPFVDIYPNLIIIDTNNMTETEVFDYAIKEIRKIIEKEKTNGNIMSRRKQISYNNSNK